MKYLVRIQYPDGLACLSYRDRICWCKRTALKHMRDWNLNFPHLPAHIEEE